MSERDPYYQEHVAFLHGGGERLAHAMPQVADRLSGRSLDPDVDLLLDGIAFITSKINEKVLKGHDQLCQLLFDVLFPHYLSPVPAASIVQFDSLPPGSETVEVPRGTSLFAQAIQSTECNFTTTNDVELSDLRLEKCRWELSAVGGALDLQFSGKGWGSRRPRRDRIRMHLAGEPLVTRSLFQWLMTSVKRVDLLDGDGEIVNPIRVDIRGRGYDEDEALLSYPPGSFEGFRLIQEYFTLPEKFMFFDVEGVWEELNRQGQRGTESFGLRLHVEADGLRQFAVTPQNIRLGCTPVVNLFEHSADPIVRDIRQHEYRVRPSGAFMHYEIYRVDHVTCLSPVGSTEYPQLWNHHARLAGSNFSFVNRRHFGQDVFYYLTLVDGGNIPPGGQKILTDLVCSNGQLPIALGIGDINRVKFAHDGVRGRNISAVTRPVPAPIGTDMGRRLVTHLSLGQRDLATLDAVRDVTAMYNLAAGESRQVARAHHLILDALLSLTTKTVHHPRRAVVVRGRRAELTMDESAFDTLGELYLFGCIINEYMARQSPMNTFSEFALRGLKTQERHLWPRRLGKYRLESI